jgi:hypothetical protein
VMQVTATSPGWWSPIPDGVFPCSTLVCVGHVNCNEGEQHG